MSKQISLPKGVVAIAGARMTAENRKLQILTVAVRLFSQRGFVGTTTKEIAQAAGVSEAMVFRHFATKQELYSAILDHKACSGDSMNPEQMVAEALKQKDDRAVFEQLALGALDHHECDPEFQRLLLHSALEGHELAEMFFEKFIRRVYQLLADYIIERQRDGAIVKVDPFIIIRSFIGMIIHHSLNNNLWDPHRRLLQISNRDAAKYFTDILLNGISAGAPPKLKSKVSTGVSRNGQSRKKPARKK
ncbi:MAG TPA: TetR/AcrR family transcriptional regulator [Pyrinomonadaceae bacterium]|nr:TetR/AcrR family transcriptional regulator [Pyrinomonadaceae bacterium]